MWPDIPKLPKITSFAISLQYLKKELGDEVDFLYADKHESLLQTDSMILMEILKHSQSPQNSKFAMSLQYLKKVFFLKNTLGIKVSYKVDIIINWHDQAFSNYSKQQVCHILAISQERSSE